MVAVMVAYTERAAIAHLVPFMLDAKLATRTEMGFVLSAFGLGYVAGLPFSGIIIRSFGHSQTLLLLALGWAVAALGFVFARNVSGLFGARFALGLFEAPLFPLFVSWIALNSSRKATPVRLSLIEACSYVGMALAGPIAVFSATFAGWRVAYLGIGTLGLLVAALAPFLTNPPAGAERPSIAGKKAVRGAVITLAAVGAGFLVYNFAKNFYSTWFPTILVEGYGYSSAEAAKLTFFQSLIAPAASVGCALVSSRLSASGVSLRLARAVPLGFGFALGGLLIVAAIAPAHLYPIAIISFVGLISTSALVWNTVPDATDPSDVGQVAGWVNAVANVGTIASPLVISQLMPLGYGMTLITVGSACVLAIPMFVFAYRQTRQSEP